MTRNLSGGPTETFTYGTTDNRLQSAAVTGQPTRTFTHDSAGNITIDDRGAGNTVVITIGADDRPQVVTVSGVGATTVTLKHNAFGERVSRVEGANTTHFHYDQDGRLIAETDGTGALVREYLWLGDKPLGLVVGPAGSATLYFVQADHLERPQKITDAAQAIVWDGQFTPYGRTHAITGAIQNPLRFPGQWADPAAGYFYNYMRDYDPTLARYLSVDPIGTRGGRNKFVYAAANPVNRVDRLGLSVGDPLGITGPNKQLMDFLERLFTPSRSCPIPQGMPYTGAPPADKDERCRQEWEDAERICIDLLSRPNPPRGLTGGYKNLFDCMRGHVSEECGGNPVDWGPGNGRRR